MVISELQNVRIGETAINKFGTEFQIIDYKSSHSILIETTDSNKYRKWINYRDFKLGKIGCPFDKSVFGVGYLGIGPWKASENKIKFNSYLAWQSMLGRCYSPILQKERPKYKRCIVSDEWHNYQNFAQWWNENYYQCKNEKMCLDKDLLVKNNTIYSKDTCLIVPNRINTLIENCTAARGDLPLGVSIDKKINMYKSTSREIINSKSEKVHLGYYNTPEEAFNAYKKYKEKYIKEVADKYKNIIPKKVYNALYNFKIEITD